MERGRILDLKEVATTNPRDCAPFPTTTVITDAAYMSASCAQRPESLGRTLMTFRYVEIEPLDTVAPAVPGAAMRDIGAQRRSRAVELWQRGLATGERPHYREHGPVTLETPAYLIRELVKESIEDAMAPVRIYQRGMDVMRCEVVEECERRPASLVRARETTYDRDQAESRRGA